MKKLNLGCGDFKKEGYINSDISERTKPDILLNLDQIPYPFKNNVFDIIEADHVLEHLSEPFEVMKELHRILNTGGRLEIRVPHFSRALSHPQHKAGFDVTFPKYFDDKFPGGFTGVSFACASMKLKWFSQKYLMKKILSPFIFYVLSTIGLLVDIFANISPSFCSRIWCFWVGGFYEIEFIFRKPIDDENFKPE